MNINTASTQYAIRPKDERFDSFPAMIKACQDDQEICAEAKYNLRDLHIRPVDLGGVTRVGPAVSGILLESPKGAATLTHYSFGQLLKTIGPQYSKAAHLLRTLPAPLASDVLNQGLRHDAPTGTRANILIRDNDQDPYPVVRAATSETYGRLWDGGLYANVERHFGDGMPTNGGSDNDRVWQSPPTREGGRTENNGNRGGNYRGDRDSFCLRIDGGSIVGDPSRANSQDGGQMFRGLMIRNSEVGLCSVTIDVILYRYICGNHILWGATLDRTFKRRHYGKHITQDVINELLTLARKFNHRAASDDVRIIKALIDHEIAHTKDAVIDELRKMGATIEQATEAYKACEMTENASPRSYWGIAQGLTRNSQESGWQDERLALDQLAAKVMKAGAKLYQMA